MVNQTMDRYESSIMTANNNDSDTISHYTHFLLTHAKALKAAYEKQLAFDYYKEADFYMTLFNYGVKDWSEHFPIYQIGLSDVVESELFLTSALKELEKEETHLWKNEVIIINGVKLTERQSTVLVEAIYGHVEFGIQYEGFLEEACGISPEEQKEAIHEINEMFIR